jgi:hypothetical protein
VQWRERVINGVHNRGWCARKPRQAQRA